MAAPSPASRTPRQGSLLRHEIDTLFRVPDAVERWRLCEALARVVAESGWAGELLGGERLVGELNLLAETLWTEIPSGLRERLPAYRPLTGDFVLAGAMLGDTSLVQQVERMQRLRALCWLALRHDQLVASGPISQHAEVFASALGAAARRTVSKAAEALREILWALDQAASLSAAIGCLSLLEFSGHRGLKDAWIHWLHPALKAIAEHELSQPTEPPPSPPSEPRPGKRKPRPSDGDREPIITPLWPIGPRPGQLPGEPPDELAEPIDLVQLRPGLTQGEARYCGQQAVWSANRLLLTCHPDALPPEVYGAAIAALVHRMGEADPDDEMVLGHAAILLSAISGRTVEGLLTLHTAPAPGPDRAALRTWHLDLTRGQLVLPVFWQLPNPARKQADAPTGYFKADPTQAALVCSTADRITLPLPRPIHRALSRHETVVARLSSLELSELDEVAARMRRVVSQISAEIGAPLSLAGLRRSIAPLLMEACGDPAIVQLICGDSFGLSTAPLHYYAPRRGDLAKAYLSTLVQFFGGSAGSPIAEAGSRVGSQLLVTPEAAKALASASFSHDPAAAGGDRSTQWRHRRLLDHLVRMLLATTGHRPTNGLFEFTLADLDLDHGALLARDKVHDVAHDPRLLALPTVAVTQLQIYLRHLQALAAELPALRAEIDSILAGETPLLIDLNNGGELTPTTIDIIRQRGPDIWRVLPLNWGRTYLRTRGIETGGSAFLLACQLGHLDAVGYPYSLQSPTEPVEVLAALRPVLDRLARNQGWQVLDLGNSDVRPSQRGGRLPPPSTILDLPALIDWRPRIQSAENAARSAHRQWEKQLKTGTSQRREEALSAVLKHPTLLAVGISAIWSGESAQPSVEFHDVDLDKVRDELVLDCDDDAASAVARVRAMREVVRKAASVAGVEPPRLPAPVAVRRPLDNAFFSGACLALTQVCALRRHQKNRAREKSPARPYVTQVARAAEALAIYGQIDDAPTLLDIINARRFAVASARIHDLILVPLSDGRVIALRHLAALALAALAEAHPDAPLPAMDQIEQALEALLPDWACPAGHRSAGLLERLCSTIAVANRFELSPAARFAGDPERGCMHASLDEQIAFIDRDPVGPLRPKEPMTADSTAGSVSIVNSKPASATAHGQYQHLVSLLPSGHSDHALPLTGITLTATGLKDFPARRAVVSEIDAWISRSDSGSGERLYPVVRMLADWVLSELDRRKPDGTLLANSTVSTYLTRIGKSLSRNLHQADASRWDEYTLEEAYTLALKDSAETRDKAAAALLAFHHHCQSRFDLPEADLSPLWAELRRHERRGDTEMILPVERDAAIAEIARSADGYQSAELGATRAARIADFIALSVAQGGARISEPLGLQLRDVGARPGNGAFIRLRPNGLRRIKTSAGRRILQLEYLRDPHHHQRALSWASAVRKQAGARRTDSVYVTQDLEQRTFSGHGSAVRTLREALARQTGRRSERLHRLRHLAATERLTQKVLSAEDAEQSGWEVPETVAGRPLQPRDLHGIAIPLGHAHWATTIQCYLHIPWLFRSRSACRLRDQWFGRLTAASALGLTPAALDDLTRGVKDRTALEVWFDRFRKRRQPPSPQPSPEPAPEIRMVWSAQQLGKLFNDAFRTKDLLASLRLVGAPLNEAERVERFAARWEFKLGLRLLPEYVGSRKRSCPKRAIRRLAGDDAIEGLWRIYDEGSETQREILDAVAEECFVYLQASKDHQILLSPERVTALKRLLESTGTDPALVDSEEHAGGLLRVQVARAQGSGARLGLALKRVLATISIVKQLARAAAQDVTTAPASAT